jgi:hypothetical protein
MTALSAEDLAGLCRWAICGGIVVLAHGAIAAGMVNWRDEIEPTEPAAAIVVEFAPLPVGPAAPQTEVAPGPEQVMSEASPEKPVEHVEDEQKLEEKVASRPVEEPPLEIKPAPNPDVAAAGTRNAETAKSTHASADDLRSAGAFRAKRRRAGCAHAGPGHPQHLERGADVENAHPGVARAPQALSGERAISPPARDRRSLLQPRPAGACDR